MADIRERYILEDQFSAPLERYIQLAQQASGLTSFMKAALEVCSASAQAAAGSSNLAAQATQTAAFQQQEASQAAAFTAEQSLSASDALARMAEQQLEASQAVRQNADTQAQAAQTALAMQEQLSSAVQQSAAAQTQAAQAAVLAQEQAAVAVQTHSDALKRAETSARNYQAGLNSVERRLIKANAAFNEMLTQQEAMIAAGERNTAAFQRLDAQVDRQGSNIRALEVEQSELTRRYDEATAAIQREAAALAQAKAAVPLSLPIPSVSAPTLPRQDTSVLTAASSVGTPAAQAAAGVSDAASLAATGGKAFSGEADLAAKAASSLTQELKKLAGAYLSVQGMKKAVDLSDTLVSSRARLDRMNDGLQTTAQLEQMIYQAAQDSRGSFLDTMGLVSQLGTMAPEAFSSSKEIVQFAEQLNKQLALSGANGQAAQAAILQLEQGLASGVLRGDELNSVMEQAPALAKAVAGYMDVSIGQLRELGSQGVITADVVKNALFSAAEETNKAFAQTPMTWAQVWTMASNAAIRAFDPLLSAINWTANNLETLIPIVLSVGAAFSIMLIAANWTNILTFATQKAAAAQAFLNAVLSANPFALAAAGVLLLVAVLYGGVAVMNHFAGTSVSATGIITGAFAVMGAFIYNSVLVPLQNGFAMFVNFIGNAFNNLAAAVKILFYDMAITVMQYIQNIASSLEGLINMIPGVQVDLTSGIDAWVTKLTRDRRYEKWASGYTEYVTPWQNMDLGKAYTDGYNWGANLDLSKLMSGFLGSGSALGLGELPGFDEFNGTLSSIDGNVSSLNKKVDLSDETIKMLVDIAERKYVNNINLTTQSPVITVYGQNTGDSKQDTRNLLDELRSMLQERLDGGATVSPSGTY